MEQYSGGVFSDAAPATQINHVVSLIGWGQDEQKNEYWIVRNSWGTDWGEGGFMRLVTSNNQGPAGTNNDGIEGECFFGLVDRFDYE